MKTICLYFQIHQPFRLKRYRFFNIGYDHYYYDDFANEDIMQRIAERSFVPANRMMLELLQQYKGKFKVAFSISGTALEQLEIYSPEVIDGFKELAKTGGVEFLAETYSHSLASLIDPVEFEIQVKAHSRKIENLFGQKPKVFRNTELIYSDEIADIVDKMGFRGVITEGAKHILGWKSPNYLYQSITNPRVKLLLRNSKFSNDISYRFANYNWNEYPLTADKFINWLGATPDNEQLINLFMNYEVLGNLHNKSTGIFEFFKALPVVAMQRGISFSTPSDVLNTLKPVDSISVTEPISWSGEESDLTAWQGNIMQEECLQELYKISERVRMTESRRIKQDWSYLQTSDHFFYMSTKILGDGPSPFSPYPSPYEAFNNYMNILSDFIERVEAEYPSTIENEELNGLLKTIHSQGEEIDELKEEMKKLRARKTKKEETGNK
ncbi:MAG: glycoside hydrolase family 57 protein [Dysgonamonadaceae bacterium]